MSATSPDQLPQLFQRAQEAGDLDAAMALFEPAAVFSDAQGKVSSGLDAIRETMASFFAMKADHRITTLKVIEAGDIALTHNAVTLRVGAAEMSGRTIEIARRQPDGRWLYVMIFHANDDHRN